MLYKNALIFTEDGFRKGSFRVENGRFAELFTDAGGAGEDLHGARVIPGLVEIHTHGNSRADFSDGDWDGLVKMARYLASRGVTSFAPASVTSPVGTLKKAFSTAVRLRDEAPAGCARLVGVHMEGPFLSEARKGAQNGAFLLPPDKAVFDELYDAADGLLRIVDVAPELPDAGDFAAYAAERCRVSAAHTDADYDTARGFFSRGGRHVTHLYNCMPPLLHRAPGVIGAASERMDVTAELICDGYHVHESAVRAAFRLFPGRICLVSDSLRCCGMPDGEYTLGGLPVFLSGGVARLADGTIAGAAADLFTCLQKAISFGIPEREAILAATRNPAQALGLDAEIGSVAVGKRADFVVCDENYQLLRVEVAGSF